MIVVHEAPHQIEVLNLQHLNYDTAKDIKEN